MEKVKKDIERVPVDLRVDDEDDNNDDDDNDNEVDDEEDIQGVAVDLRVKGL